MKPLVLHGASGYNKLIITQPPCAGVHEKNLAELPNTSIIKTVEIIELRFFVTDGRVAHKYLLVFYHCSIKSNFTRMVKYTRVTN